MKLTSEKKGTVHIVRIEGVLDFNTNSEFEKYVKNLAQEPNLRLILDLENVIYIDSTGMGSLVGLMITLKRNNGLMSLVNVMGFIEEVLHYSKLNLILKIEEDLETAIANLESANN